MGERECHWNDLWEVALHPSGDGARPDSSLGGGGRTGRVPAAAPARSYLMSRVRGVEGTNRRPTLRTHGMVTRQGSGARRGPDGVGVGGPPRTTVDLQRQGSAPSSARPQLADRPPTTARCS